MEKELQDLVEQLGSAIDESIAESERIGEIVHEMERAGYDLTLVLEASMRFTPKDAAADQESRRADFHPSLPSLKPVGKFDLTPQDQEFLQALKVGF